MEVNNTPLNDRFFGVAETDLHWKMPFRTLTAREKSMPAFKASKDALTPRRG